MDLDIVDFFDTYNPLALKDENGKVLYFETYQKCYLYFMKRVKMMYPKGYIDMVHFFHTWGYMDFMDAQRYVNTCRSLGLQEEMFLTWEEEIATRDDFEIIIKSVHNLVETSFERNMFLAAFNQFKFEELQKYLKQ